MTSLPFMITTRIRETLRRLNYLDSEIDKMTPLEAFQILKQQKHRLPKMSAVESKEK